MTQTINVLKEYLEAKPLYEATYLQYINFFERLSVAEEPLNLEQIPVTWTPFAHYLGHNVVSTVYHFESCVVVSSMVPHFHAYPDPRAFVEAVSTFRPELVDTLWKYDVEWADRVPSSRRNKYVTTGREILITNNGSYHRPEIIDYFQHLDAYTPTKRNVVLVPCAADKPYPAPMHQAVLDRMPEDFYLANITGVLGVVPMDLWPVMPMYDSGIPNEWRLVNVAREYFKRNEHDRIVVYIDFYSLSLENALRQVGVLDRVTWVNPVEFYSNYLDLMEPQRLVRLEQAFAGTLEAA